MSRLFIVQSVQDQPSSSLYWALINAESASEARSYLAAYTQDNRWLDPAFALLMNIGTANEAVRPGVITEKLAP